MTIEDAIKKYSIPIPKDIFNYDKNEFKEFNTAFLKSFYNTFGLENTEDTKSISSQRNSCNRIAVVLGGQTGAGKNSLVAETKREFQERGRGIVLIDDDVYRSFHPYAEEILSECPEFYTIITASVSSKVTPKILKFASENGFNFIFDGTMKNDRILQTMKSWKDYTILAKIMATSRPRSLGGIAIRNGELRKLNGKARFIKIDAHDETYYGIPKTVEELYKSNLAKEIRIYTRGEDPFHPIQKYSSAKNNVESPKIIMERLREADRKDFLKSAQNDIETITKLLKWLSPKEQREYLKIIEIMQNEIDEKKTQTIH